MALEFVTGDAILPGFITVNIKISKSQSNWLYSAFLGAIYNMGIAESWITGGESTPEDAAEQFEWIFDNGITPVLFDVGDIKWSGSNVAPIGAWLLCDGGTYSQTTYAELFAALGTNFNTGGEPAGTFRVPDLRGRAAVVVNSGSGRLPAWANTIGGSGGESDHTLTIGEMPSHNHAINNFTETGTAVPPPSDAGTEIPHITAFTAYEGGGGSHNNVQPSLVLYAYILSAI
jgi:microcystin-dependent protein